jgi:hypothetical protein
MSAWIAHRILLVRSMTRRIAACVNMMSLVGDNRQRDDPVAQ